MRTTTMRDGDYVIGPNAGHGKIISTAEFLALATDAQGFTTGEASDIGTALVKWTDGTHGRYPRRDLRVVEFRPCPAFYPEHEGF